MPVVSTVKWLNKCRAKSHCSSRDRRAVSSSIWLISLCSQTKWARRCPIREPNDTTLWRGQTSYTIPPRAKSRKNARILSLTNSTSIHWAGILQHSGRVVVILRRALTTKMSCKSFWGTTSPPLKRKIVMSKCLYISKWKDCVFLILFDFCLYV